MEISGFFFFNDTATTEIYPLPLHDALPIYRVDRRSGVSQRLPITTLESVVSSAEQRAARIGEKHAVARAADVYAALPAITGKMELEYEIGRASCRERV